MVWDTKKAIKFAPNAIWSNWGHKVNFLNFAVFLQKYCLESIKSNPSGLGTPSDVAFSMFFAFQGQSYDCKFVRF